MGDGLELEREKNTEAKKTGVTVSAAPGRGLNVATNNGLFAMTVRGRAQIRDTVLYDGRLTTNEINVKTLRLVLQGHVLTPDLKYNIQLAFGGVELADLRRLRRVHQAARLQPPLRPVLRAIRSRAHPFASSRCSSSTASRWCRSSRSTATSASCSRRTTWAGCTESSATTSSSAAAKARTASARKLDGTF